MRNSVGERLDGGDNLAPEGAFPATLPAQPPTNRPPTPRQRSGEIVADDAPIIQPPGTFTVEHERKPVLYLPDGRALVKRPIGFRTDP